MEASQGPADHPEDKMPIPSLAPVPAPRFL